jgi:hypothetical protein
VPVENWIGRVRHEQDKGYFTVTISGDRKESSDSATFDIVENLGKSAAYGAQRR